MIYVVDFRGHPACPCLAAWLPVFEQELIRRGVVEVGIDIAQLIGNAAASAGVHAEGGAFDIWQDDDVTELVAREMGAAAWNRNTGSFANNRHTHGVLNGCPHNGPARYQIPALAAGYDGLGSGGRGGPDTGNGPRLLRTWREGIVWAQRLQEDDMKPEDFDQIRAVIREEIAAQKLDVGKPSKWSDDTVEQTQLEQLRAIGERLTRMEKSLDQSAKAVGKAVNEGAKNRRP